MALKQFNTPESTQVWWITFRPAEHIAIEAGDAHDLPAPPSISTGYGVVIFQAGETRYEQI
ncbi:hypothetical protein DIE07_15275 [Burkholderia sp. Bp9002]|nr:hypothetical protein DIE07_15275 [Burkholderia sp. Bp9002]